MTTFYEELCIEATIDMENKEQVVLRVVKRWIENSPILDAALAGKISLEVLVGPIVSPNLRISFFNREEDTFNSTDFKKWSDQLFGQLGAILPLRKIFSRGYPKDFIDLRLPVKLSKFYEVERHLFIECLGAAVILLLWTGNFTPSAFWQALVIGIAIGSCLELFFFCLNASFHFHRRRQMARELLRQARNIDRIFYEASLG